MHGMILARDAPDIDLGTAAACGLPSASHTCVAMPAFFSVSSASLQRSGSFVDKTFFSFMNSNIAYTLPAWAVTFPYTGPAAILQQVLFV